MKIGKLDSAGVPAATTGEARRQGAAAAATSTRETGASVTLSPALEAFNAPTAPESFDVQKVERITQAIREGRFTIDAEAIADRLIADVRETSTASTS